MLNPLFGVSTKMGEDHSMDKLEAERVAGAIRKMNDDVKTKLPCLALHSSHVVSKDLKAGTVCLYGFSSPGCLPVFCSQSLVFEAPLRHAALVREVTHGHGSSTLSTIVPLFRCCDDWFMLIDQRRSLQDKHLEVAQCAMQRFKVGGCTPTLCIALPSILPRA